MHLNIFQKSKSVEPALTALLQLYERRPDLQEVYPEVRGGHYERLITWAANASTGQSKDSARAVLAPHAGWYKSNFQVVAAPTPWAAITNTYGASANTSPVTLSVMQYQHATDISYHLPTLSLLIIEFGLRNIVELGTRSGNSTLVMLEAAQHVGGKVLSVDIDPCTEAKDRIAAAKLDHLWTFIQGNDMEVDGGRLPEPIDLLFIDTNHLYRYTIQELQRYSQFLRSGSWIVLHDYVSFPGVNRAVEEFVKTRPMKPHFYPFVHQNGLALLKVK